MSGEQLSILGKQDPDELIRQAVAEHQPVASYCLFSGGNDSSVLAHRCRDRYDALAFIDTGTAVPGVREFVAEFAEWLGKPLVVYEAGDAFERMVLGDDVWWQRMSAWRVAVPGMTIADMERHNKTHYGVGSGVARTSRMNLEGDVGTGTVNLGAYPHGFPSPPAHGRAYSRLKERQIEKLIREVKTGGRMDRVMLLTGKRRQESARRGRTTQGIELRRAQLYVNPLIDWSTYDMRAYRVEHELPENPVAALLHRSGECNCGAFAQAAEERGMLKGLWPEWWQRIELMEAEAERRGIRWCRWGGYDVDGLMAKEASAEAAGSLCTDCELRQFTLPVAS